MTQAEALDILKLGRNAYLTGSAGSGKTYVLNEYIAYLRAHDVEVGVTASTGIAATHMNGVTIHSWSGMGVRDTLSATDISYLEEKQYLWKRFERARVLIIDEVSMLHHFQLDLVDRICRTFKRNEEPFGGLQVILCGDFFQLPPVGRTLEESRFVFHSEAWETMDLKVCYLHEQHRQKDKAFLAVLTGIRENRITGEILGALKTRHNAALESKVKPTKLFTHNVDVDAVNSAELEKLEGELHSYTMTHDGYDNLVDTIKKSCLAPEKLKLKKDALVMFVKNNFEAGYVNGTLGTIVAFDENNMPLVETYSGKRITATPVEWTIEEGDKVLASIEQIPLRLAWAITVHKSQGMSLDAVEVDLSKSFEKGMGYVALSRVRSLLGLKLLGLNDEALEVHPEILEFDGELQEESEKTLRELARLPRSQKEKLQKEYLERIMPPKGKKKKKNEKMPTHHITKTLLEEGVSLEKIAAERELTVETIISHIEHLRKEGDDVDIEYIKRKAFGDTRFDKIERAFRESFERCGDYRLAPVKNALGKGFSYEEIRLARLFIEQSA